jgi:TonB family protein
MGIARIAVPLVFVASLLGQNAPSIGVGEERWSKYKAGAKAWAELDEALHPALVANRYAPGPLPDTAEKDDLIKNYGSVADEGIVQLRRAIELDPNFADAMFYLNLLIRDRATLRETPEEYERDIKEAEIWLGRSRQVTRTDNPVVRQAPPPVTPAKIRVGTEVQQAESVQKIEPVCPALAVAAKISGVVRLKLRVERDGNVRSVQYVSGHALLAPAAVEAAKQWTFGASKGPQTKQVDIEMHCGQ